MKKAIFLIFSLFLFGCTSPRILSIRDNPVFESSPAKTNLVTIAEGRFSPDSVKIKKGAILTITNAQSSVWTLAADPHPVHSTLGGLYQILHKDEKKEYQFKAKGSFGIHLEENPSVTLKIMVE